MLFRSEFVCVAESSANKVIKEDKDHMNSVIDRIKDLPNWQVDNFLVALVIKAQEYSDFKAHPIPSATARGFICKYFEGGKP